MICKNCRTKMTCRDTWSPNNFQYVFRRYTCKTCGIIEYTEEHICSEKLGKKWFKDKREFYKPTENSPQ